MKKKGVFLMLLLVAISFASYVVLESFIHKHIEVYKVGRQRSREYEKMHIGVDEIASLPALETKGDEWFVERFIISHSGGGGKWLCIYKFP